MRVHEVVARSRAYSMFGHGLDVDVVEVSGVWPQYRVDVEYVESGVTYTVEVLIGLMSVPQALVVPVHSSSCSLVPQTKELRSHIHAEGITVT